MTRAGFMVVPVLQGNKVYEWLVAVMTAAVMLTAPASAQSSMEAYLSGYYAATNNNFQDAADYAETALMADPDSHFVQSLAMEAYLSSGRISESLELARNLHADGHEAPLLGAVMIVDDFINNHSRIILEESDTFDPMPEVINRLAHTWSLMKEGRVEEALDSFTDQEDPDDIAVIMAFHATLAHALAGDYETSLRIASEVKAYPDIMIDDVLYILAQLHAVTGNTDRALELLEPRIYSEIDTRKIRLMDLYDRLASGENIRFDYVESAYGGLSQAYIILARIYLSSGGYSSEALQHLRLASVLDPDNPLITLEMASLLLETDNAILSHYALADIPSDSIMSPWSSTLNANALYAAGDVETALEILQQGIVDNPAAYTLPLTLGDIYRQEERFDEAIDAYDLTLQRIDANEDVDSYWPAYFYRAITYEKLDQWNRAEDDFWAALEFSDNSPFMLNYLGYSLADRNIRLEEAEKLILKAVEAEPSNGMYIDSLGWVLYQMERYDEALAQLELAVRLMSPDPIVIDHLGDAYWMTGKENYAYEQWEIALGLAEDDELAEQIRNKLEAGLIPVLEN